MTFLPQSLLAKRVHDTDLKLIANAGYDIDRIINKTETGGLFIDGAVDQVITAGGTAQIITNWTNVYFPKIVVPSAVNGTLITTAGLSFDISGKLTIVRRGVSLGAVKVQFFSSNDGILGETAAFSSPQVSETFELNLSAVAITAISTLTVRIVGDTITGETFTVSDANYFIESTT